MLILKKLFQWMMWEPPHNRIMRNKMLWMCLEFEGDDVGTPSEPPVNMGGFTFDIDPHFDNLSKLADQCMEDDKDHDAGYNFDEFHSDEEGNCNRLVNLRKKRLKEIRREYEGRLNVKKGEFFASETFPRPKDIKQKLRTYALES